MRLRLLLGVSCFLWLSCSRSKAPSVMDAGALDDAGLALGTPPEDLVVTLAAALSDGGVQTVTFRPDEKPVLEPSQALEVSANRGFTNYRVRVFDEADKVVASDDVPHDGPAGLRYGIQLAEPLRTGYRYALVLDPQVGSAMTDTRGQEHPEMRFEFTVAGDRQRPVRVTPASKGSKRKARSRR